jgi:hypothetical protein
VNIARDLWADTAFADEPFSEREAWVWMICEASWKRREKRIGGTVVETERGQFAASVRFMAEAFKWSKSRVHRFLDRLKNRDMIGTASGTGILVVTIRNYDKYQSGAEASGTLRERDTGQQRDSSGTNEKKGERRVKEEVEDTNVSLSSCDDAPAPANDLSHAVNRYNAAADKAGWPKVHKLSPARSRLLKARLADCGGIEGWEVALRKAFDSDFCRGRTAKAWMGFSFDWITKSANFTKLMEGNYDNRAHAHGQKPNPAGTGRPTSLAGIVAQRRLDRG